MSIPSFPPGQESGTNGPGWAISQGLDDQAFEAIDQTVRHAAGAIDGLRDILERLQKSVAQATEQRRNDIEIGHLFSKAEEFVEGAVSEGHELAQRIIADAEFEASMIVTAAKEEASRLIAEGRRATSVPSEAVSALEATIREFARMNKAITDQLALVGSALTNQRESRINRSGDWQPQSDYGPIWFPRVEAGWAPYHYGHWVNIPFYGWSWVADESWGAAPFHYGRWVVVGGRWGWIPGPREGHPVYAR